MNTHPTHQPDYPFSLTLGLGNLAHFKEILIMTPISIKTINDRTSRKLNALATNANSCIAKLDDQHADLLKEFTKNLESIPTVYRTNEDSYRSVLRFRFENGEFIQGAFSPVDGWSWQGALLNPAPTLEFQEDFYQAIFLSILTTWLLDQCNKQ